jgi:hypothetical protein
MTKQYAQFHDPAGNINDPANFIAAAGTVPPWGSSDVHDSIKAQYYAQGWRTVPLTWKPPERPKTPEQIQKELTDAIQAHLDGRARERGYDDIKSAVTYEGDEDPIFAAEGLAYKRWRSAAWRYCYNQLALIQGGQRTDIPTPESIVAEIQANVPLVLP